MEEVKDLKEVKEFKEERFEFALYVNNNVICKRNFKINNYIDESMQSLDFKQKVDEIKARFPIFFENMGEQIAHMMANRRQRVEARKAERQARREERKSHKETTSHQEE